VQLAGGKTVDVHGLTSQALENDPGGVANVRTTISSTLKRCHSRGGNKTPDATISSVSSIPKINVISWPFRLRSRPTELFDRTVGNLTKLRLNVRRRCTLLARFVDKIKALQRRYEAKP
jgi:hypothetical protein